MSSHLFMTNNDLNGRKRATQKHMTNSKNGEQEKKLSNPT